MAHTLSKSVTLLIDDDFAHTTHDSAPRQDAYSLEHADLIPISSFKKLKPYHYLWEQIDGEWREVEDYNFSPPEQQAIVVLADYPLHALGKASSRLLADQIPPSVEEVTQYLGQGRPVE